jgi:hypothetical protein
MLGQQLPCAGQPADSTMLNEAGFRPDEIERQLAHKERNQVRASYNQAEYLEGRMAMMQQWADRGAGMAKEEREAPLTGYTGAGAGA